jgi:protein O-GlcNAc transferase
LATLRSSLRSRMESSPIMNAPLYTHHLENAYREMIESARNAER